MDGITIDSWGMLNEIASQLDLGPVHEKRIAFRGHSKSHWKLSPTLHRIFEPAEYTAADIIQREYRLFLEFRETAHHHMPLADVPHLYAVQDWWFVMRHFGAPTRLLDWSYSMYVAAYFAVVDDWMNDGAIWQVNINGLMHRAGVKLPPTITLIEERMKWILDQILLEDAPPNFITVASQKQFARMAAQQGLFTYCLNAGVDQHDLMMDTLADVLDVDTGIRKYIVPKECKPDFLRRLRMMNLTGRVLFPDAQGLGRQTNELANLIEFEANAARKRASV